jgi:hypothetical protein
LFVTFPSVDKWIQGFRLAVPLLGFLSAATGGEAARSEEAFARWAIRPANSSQRPVLSETEHSFEAFPNRSLSLSTDQTASRSTVRSLSTGLLDTPISDPSDAIERTAYQAQYPLSKDSSDLLPDERRLRSNTFEPNALDESEEMTDDLVEPDELFDSSGDRPWIVWQKTTASATWVAPKKGDGLGVTSLDVRGSIEFPNFQALWFVPRVASHFLNGPQTTDLPGQLYDFSFETVAMIPASEKVFFQVAFAPSLFTDSKNTSHGAFRLPGRLLGFWKYSETLMFNAGVFYLDRDDVKWLPVAGLVWNYSDDLKFELMAPRPRIAWRFSQAECDERWAYIVGEFGGGTWAVQRASGVNDVATLQDYKLMLGVERKWDNVKSWWFETGYVFSRRVKFTSAIGDTTSRPVESCARAFRSEKLSEIREGEAPAEPRTPRKHGSAGTSPPEIWMLG